MLKRRSVVSKAQPSRESGRPRNVSPGSTPWMRHADRQTWTLWAASLLFLAFGVKMLAEARSMSASHMSEEMREVEEELEHDTAAHDMANPRGMAVPLEDLEEGAGGGSYKGRALASPRSASRHSGLGRSRSPSPKRPLSGGAREREKGAKEDEGVLARMSEVARGVLQTLVNPVFAQAFVLTFLGEWGDRYVSSFPSWIN